MFENSFDAILIEDCYAKVIDCNQTACIAFGYEKNELIGMSAFDLVPNECKKTLEALNAKILDSKNKDESFLIEACAKKKDGTIFNTEVSIVSVDLDEEIRLIVSVRNITSRKKSEAAKSRYSDQISQLQKLETLGTLASGISNDFNNMLTGVIGYSELIKRDVPMNLNVAEKSDKIIETARQAGERIRQLFEYSENSFAELKETDLRALLNDVFDTSKSMCDNELQLESDFAESLPNILANNFQLKKSLLNLIENSAEAGSSSGKVTLSANLGRLSFSGSEPGYFGSPMNAGDYIIVSVTDNGCGMDEEVQNRIFEPFYSNRFAKRGLGLTSVLKMVRNHHGAIKIDSEKGKGTVVSVMLPILEKNKNNGAVRGEVAQSIKYPENTALVVDDDEHVRELLNIYLSDMGYRVISAQSGKECIEKFKKYAKELDVVLLDIAMPGIDGIDALRELQWLNPEIPVIVCSGIPLEELKESLSEFGETIVLEKPFDFEKLGECLLNLELEKNTI